MLVKKRWNSVSFVVRLSCARQKTIPIENTPKSRGELGQVVVKQTYHPSIVLKRQSIRKE